MLAGLENGPGVIRPASQQEVGRAIETLIAQSVQAVILGCTELPLLIGKFFLKNFI